MQAQVLEFETDRIIDAAQAIGESRGFEKGIKQGIEEGIKQGIEKGIKQGIEKGIKQGVEKGRALGIIDLGRLKGASKEGIVLDLAGVFNVSVQDASNLYDQLLIEHTKQPNA